MSAGALHDLWIEEAGGVLAACGRADRDEVPDHLVGFDLSGHLAAACLAAGRGQDVGFLRRRDKKHGTGKVLDGAVDGRRAGAVVCAVVDEEACRRRLSELGLSGIPVLTFALEAKCDSGFSAFTGSAGPRRPPTALSDAAWRLEGRFVLSSGAQATAYWETLPAANRYSVVSALEVSGRAFAGVGHGGAFAGGVLALSAGAQPLAIDPYAAVRPVLAEAPILLDDFATTGGSFRKAAGAIHPPAQAHVRCVALYALADAIPRLGGIEVLETLT
jgi:orotate phosphoribosyltransferase